MLPGAPRNARSFCPSGENLARYQRFAYMKEFKAWSVQDAKARFSEFLDACLEDGPQVVTLRGVEQAILVPVKEWEAMRVAAKPSLKELLLTGEANGELQLPERGRERGRPVEPET